MPGRYSGRRFGNRGIRPVINSIKNVMNDAQGLTGSAVTAVLAKAVSNPVNTVATDTAHGCVIKAIWISFDVCGLAGTGVSNVFDAYLIKNPGANLTLPAPISVGTSNEKKFVIKMWRAMIMRIQDGPNPYHWEGWIKIPKRYHRMGTDDLWQFSIQSTASVTGLYSLKAIYKWYT